MLRFGLMLSLLLLTVAAIVAAGAWAALVAVGAISASSGLRVVALVILVAGVGCFVALGRAVRRRVAPFGSLIEAAAQIERGDYSARVPERGGRDVRGLARAFNAMSARLSAIDTQRRSFLADVAHELRTPISIMRGRLEAMLDGIHPRDDEHLRAILVHAASLERLVGDVATVAQAETGGLPCISSRSTWPCSRTPSRTTSARRRARRASRSAYGCRPRRCRSPPTLPASARRSRTWWRTRCATARRAARSRYGSSRAATGARPRRPRRRPGDTARDPRAGVRALRAGPRLDGQRARPRDRRRHRRGPRRLGDRHEHARGRDHGRARPADRRLERIRVTHTDDIERTLDSYRDRIGLPVEDVATPALVLDVEALERNIAAMEQRTAGGAALRPHAKAHKSAEIAGLQLRAGAIGIMTATAWEALALARAGVTDILVGNIVRGAARCAAVVDAARHTGTTVLVDDTGNADELAAAARHAGVELDVLVDVDVGQHRTGARTPGEAVTLARHVAHTPGLRLRGVHGYEGHVSLEQDADRRRAGAATASDDRAAFVDAIRADGHPVEIVSAGGTGMWDSTGRDPRVSELHPGSYVFMDAAHWRQVPDPEASLHVLATVLTRKGQTVVLDAGRKTLGTIDPIPPVIRDVPGPVRMFHEEHAEPCHRWLPSQRSGSAPMLNLEHLMGEGTVKPSLTTRRA